MKKQTAKFKNFIERVQNEYARDLAISAGDYIGKV